MKVAGSIPDAVFSEAEDLAKRLKASRSEICSRALGEFLARHAPDRVTEAMNDAIAAVGDKSDAFSRRAARNQAARSPAQFGPYGRSSTLRPRIGVLAPGKAVQWTRTQGVLALRT